MIDPEKLAATQVQLEAEVERTPEDIRKRYRENTHWRVHPKEWIYKNIPFGDKDVLDFGCGTGEITTQIAFLGARKVYALDVTPGLLAATQRRVELDELTGRVETICGMIQDVEPRPVDVIVAYNVLHHCFPLKNVLPPLLRWLKPGGTFVALEPVSYFAGLEWLRNNSGVPLDARDEGERKLTPADLRYVFSLVSEPRIVHFRILERLSRLWPTGNSVLRELDHSILALPMAWKLAGTALIVGRGK